MEFQAFKDHLALLLKEHKMTELFQALDQQLAEQSDLQQLYLMLRNRYSRISLDLAQGIISRADENLEENQLSKGVVELISLLEASDLTATDKPWDLNSLCDMIEEKQQLLKDSVDKNSTQVIKIGEQMIKLGEILQGKPPEGSGISPLDYLKIGVKKGSRRMKIGYAEVEQTYLALLESFKQIHLAYSKLVTYLDHPTEELEKEHSIRLRTSTDELKKSIQNIEGANFKRVDFQGVVAMAEHVLSLKEQLGSEYDFLFSFMEEMKSKSLYLSEFMQDFQAKIKELTVIFRELFIELEMSIQEF